MSSFEHHATVDKGLKMKIKRKNVEKAEKNKKEQSKTDLMKSDCKPGETSQGVNGMLTDKSGKLSLFSDKDKSPKSKSALAKKDKAKSLAKSELTTSGASAGSCLNGVEGLFTQSGTMEPKLGETATGKPDPYEFNAKVEDGISTGMPMKKIKLDKDKSVDSSSTVTAMTATSSNLGSHDASTDTHDVAVVTDPDCLGPCEPGTQVTLEGIVWHESENGVLVVNVTWRGKTYVGTLLDATRHDWAPPRFNCDSPTEFESRTPGKGRGKRRGAANTPVNDTRTLRKGRRGSSAQTFTAPPSPAKSDISNSGVKRKGRPQDIDLSASEQRCSKRSRSGSQVPTPNSETPPTDAQGYLECPEPNCNKKYKNANGLKYHQSHAHSGCVSVTTPTVEDGKEDMDTEDIPLSVVKNSVRKEKEAAKSKDSKKDTNKENEKSKSDKSESVSKKSDKEESNGDAKDTAGVKGDSKCDNSNNSRKKDNNGNKNTSAQGNGKTQGSQSSNKSSSTINTSSHTTATVSSQVSNSNSTVQSVTSQSSLSSISTTTAAVTSVVLSSTQGEKIDSKLVDIKPKITNDARVTKPNRPIVPAPSHTVLSNVQVTHSNMSPVMSHTQMSPQLKPIQPKPTIMGEPQNINPALADLNKDRKKAQKKKAKDGAQNGNNQNKPEQPAIKVERTGVIKTNPLPSNNRQMDQQKREGSAVKDASRPGTGDASRSHSLTPHLHKGVDLAHSRGNHNPNLLKVGSPLQVNTPDNHKGAVNDDVQSPAYSDISDANESASPAAPSDTSPQKQKEDNSNKKDEKSETTPPQTTDGQMMSHYGMYSYYAQSPYRMNDMSPGQKSTGSNGNAPPQHSQQNPESSKTPQLSNDKKAPDEPNKPEKKTEEKDSNRPKGPPGQPMPGQPMSGQPMPGQPMSGQPMSGQPMPGQPMPGQPMPGQPMPGQHPSNMSPQQMHDYQVMCHQMYVQSLPQHLQYQYMASNGGWYPQQMDNNYMRMMDEQHRRGGQPGEPGRLDREGQGSERDSSRGPDMKNQNNSGPPSGKRDESGPQKAMISPMQGQTAERRDNVKSDDKLKDQTLRDKQNETHQILKENHELKSEMDKNRQEHYRKAEERRRYQMYQEQKMIEERKKMELARKGDTSSRPENLTTKAPGTKPIIDHTSRNLSSGQRSSMELPRDVSVKRESNSADPKVKDARDAHPRDLSANKYSDSGKTSEEKSRTPIPEKHRSETPTRNPETPKQRPGGSSSKSGSPLTSISSSVAGSPSYSPYNVNPLSYMQNPHYMGPMDPSHPLYRSHNVNPALISGYPSSGGYIHPSQMGYRPPGDDTEKEKLSAQKSSQPLPSSDSDLKKGDGGGHGGPYYNSNVHKIHELSEKGRPKSRNSSPGPVKPTDTSTSSFDKHREFTNSPPTQRHVHTHHHTHVLQPGPGLQPGPALQPPGFSPVYDPYINSAMFVSQAQSPHQFPPK